MPFESYSQHFEDFRLARALAEVKMGSYIDVGAWDPVVDSVSAAFYKIGWRGTNVEPVREHFEKYLETRREDLNLNFAISNDKRDLEIIKVASTGLSTAITSIGNSYNSYDRQIFSVNTITLDQVFDKHRAGEIHWLKIDVERYEEQVLESWQLSVRRPWIIVIEATEPGRRQRRTFQENTNLSTKGYQLAYFDGLNEFYVHESHPDLNEKLSLEISIFDEVEKIGNVVRREILSLSDFKALDDISEPKNTIFAQEISSSKLFSFFRVHTSEYIEENGSNDLSELADGFSQKTGNAEFFKFVSDQIALKNDLKIKSQELYELRRILADLQNSKTIRLTRIPRSYYFFLRGLIRNSKRQFLVFLQSRFRGFIRRMLILMQSDPKYRRLMLKALPTPLAIKLRLMVRRSYFSSAAVEHNNTLFDGDLSKIKPSKIYLNLLEIWNSS